MELNEYLDSLGLAADDRTALAAIMAKADPTRAKAPLLAHADYTRKTQALATRERELNDQLAKNLKDLETQKITASTYRARLEGIQDEYGIDVKDVLTATPAPEARTSSTPAAIDPAIMQRLERAESVFDANPRIAAILADARDEYIDLYGSTKNGPGFSAQKLLEYARENQLALRGDPEKGTVGAFERLFKVNDRRTEIMREQIRAEEKTRADGELTSRIDAMKIGDRTGERPGFVQAGSAVLGERFKSVVHERTSTPAAEGEKAPVHNQPRSAAENIRSGGAAKFEQAFMNRRMAGVPMGGKEKAA